MTQFKVGDRVRFKYDGDEGIVQEWVTPFGDNVRVDFEKDGVVDLSAGDLELVEEQPNRTYYAGATPPNAEERAGVRALLKKSTPVDPDHYKFPGGAEVIHISQWLTANSAQALQYISRSSRIDGKNKGDASEDIRKAITFLEFELKRLESE